MQGTRKTRDLDACTRRFKAVTVYAITGLTFPQASPCRLADLLRATGHRGTAPRPRTTFTNRLRQ
jgi:hypothetical protein